MVKSPQLKLNNLLKTGPERPEKESEMKDAAHLSIIEDERVFFIAEVRDDA
ncbi:MAG: hypothetical protein WC522_08775 [Candidatus Omnitrophota bacterium]